LLWNYQLVVSDVLPWVVGVSQQRVNREMVFEPLFGTSHPLQGLEPAPIEKALD